MIKIDNKLARIFAVSVVVFLCLFAALAFYTNVQMSLDAADNAVFKNYLKLEEFQHPKTFADEINAIKTIQQRIFEMAPVGAGIPDFEPREPSDLMKRHEELCFDRSRTLDKAFDYIGLPARHVYLLYRGDRSFLSALFHYGQPSHAIT